MSLDVHVLHCNPWCSDVEIFEYSTSSLPRPIPCSRVAVCESEARMLSCAAVSLAQVDDREDEYKEQIAKLQREAQAMMAKLKEQGTGLEAVGFVAGRGAPGEST